MPINKTKKTHIDRGKIGEGTYCNKRILSDVQDKLKKKSDQNKMTNRVYKNFKKVPKILGQKIHCLGLGKRPKRTV